MSGYGARSGKLSAGVMSFPTKATGTFRRVTEGKNLAILELEERTSTGPLSSVVNSVSVYAFDDAEKIVHIDIYLQMALPDPAMLQSYDGIAISGQPEEANRG